VAAVDVQRDDRGVVTVTLDNQARKNAITGVMFDELRAALVDVSARPQDRVVVITGAGEGAFCAGADLSSQTNAEGERLHTLHHMRNVGEAAHALAQVPQPVIAKVNGVAVGAGLTLALGCDLIYASSTATFGAVFVKRGLSIDFGGSWLLPRLVGMHKAKEIALLGDMFDADEAERIGLVNRVVPGEHLDAEVDALAGRLASGPTIAISLTKRLLAQAFDATYAQALEAEAMAQAVNGSTKDTNEAIRAFLEKRTPVFRGR
jgi:enoyl-CoA hydratase/carnithine racemase